MYCSRLRRNAKWRREPATASQKAILAKRMKARPKRLTADGQSEDKLDLMTKGEAANILTRLRHGAMVCVLCGVYLG